MTDEYIYGGWWGGDLSRSYLLRFRVTKRTAKRIYYQRPGERIDQHGNPYDEAQFGIKDSDLPRKEASIGSIDRWEFTVRGRVINISRGGGERRMYANLADLIARGKPRRWEDSAEEWVSRVRARQGIAGRPRHGRDKDEDGVGSRGAEGGDGGRPSRQRRQRGRLHQGTGELCRGPPRASKKETTGPVGPPSVPGRHVRGRIIECDDF